jgi:hypothetical protein
MSTAPRQPSSSPASRAPARKPLAAPAGTKKKVTASPKAAKATNAEPAAKPAGKAKPAAKPAATPAAQPAKAPKVKLVRDSFTMPQSDFALIATLKARALAAQRETKKSELLRAGLQVMAALDGPALMAALGRLQPLKLGRPKKH